MNIASSTSRLFLAKFASAIVVFAGITLFARVLGPEQIGSFFLFQALLGIASIPANFGVNPAVAKRISEGEDASVVVVTAHMLKLLPILVVSMSFYAFSGVVNTYVGLDVSSLLILGLVIQESGRVLMKTLEGELRVGETSLIRFLDRSFWVFGGGVLILYGLEVRGVIYGLIFGKFIALLLGWLRTDATLTWPSTEMAKSLFNFSKYSLVTNLGGYVYNWMDILIIGFFLGPAAVGIYEIAWRITGVVILFSSSISISIFPEISRLDSESNHGEIEKLLPNAITPSLFFILPAFVGTVLLSQEILTFVFGSSYAAGWIVLIILMGDKIAQGFQLVLGNALQAIDRPDQAAVAAVASMALNLLLNVVLVWQLGIVGAAVGTVIASVTNDVVHYRFLSREIRITWPYRELAWCTFASVVMGLLLIGVTSIMEIGSTYLLSGIIILGAAIYFPVALVHPSVRELMRSYVPYK